MPCDRKLKPKQTLQQRADEVRKAVAKLDAALASGRVTAKVGPQGAIAFVGLSDEDRDGVTDACAYRRLLVTGSALSKAKLERAAAIAGRPIDKQVIGQGAHSHDGGKTWHDHK